jgi:hypothetical protein
MLPRTEGVAVRKSVPPVICGPVYESREAQPCWPFMVTHTGSCICSEQ